MKDLTIIEQDKIVENIDDFAVIQKKFDIIFPNFLKEFILKYEGACVIETYFNGKPTFKEILVLYQNDNYASIESIMEGHIYCEIEGFIPFAIDSGGWDYNVSIKLETYGQVWVDKFDSGEENPMEFVANSFEEFINGLKAEDE